MTAESSAGHTPSGTESHRSDEQDRFRPGRGVDMDKERVRPLSCSSAARYRIEVQGALGDSWSEMFGGAEMHTIESPASASIRTVLTAVIQDQSALAGILNYVFMLRVPLLSVQCLKVLDRSALGSANPE